MMNLAVKYIGTTFVELTLPYIPIQVSVHHFRLWYTVLVYQYKTDIQSGGCYRLGRYKSRVMPKPAG